MNIAASESEQALPPVLTADAPAAIMSPALLGMYFFLASEAMFFIGMLGSFVVLKSAGDQHAIFVQSSHLLSRGIGIVSVISLLICSLALRNCRVPATPVMPTRFPSENHDAGAATPKSSSVHSGLFGWVALSIAAFFLLLQILQWKLLFETRTYSSTNNFFASYFFFSSAHSVHVLVGMITLAWVLFRNRDLSAVQIYWHFVNAVGVLSFAVLHFV